RIDEVLDPVRGAELAEGLELRRREDGAQALRIACGHGELGSNRGDGSILGQMSGGLNRRGGSCTAATCGCELRGTVLLLGRVVAEDLDGLAARIGRRSRRRDDREVDADAAPAHPTARR